MKTQDELKKCAELVDRVGNISILESGRRFLVFLRFRFTEKSEADFIFDLFPNGKFNVQEKNGQIFYWVNYQAGAVVRFLAQIEDFLVDNKRQKELVFELKAMMTLRKSGKKLPDDVVEKRRAIIQEVKDLNKELLERRNGGVTQGSSPRTD